jgi:DNA-binding protein YbaB
MSGVDVPAEPSPQQLLAAVEEAGRQAEERLAKYDDMQKEIQQLEVTMTSPDRNVTVVAGPSGSIKDLRLTDNALRASAQTLSQTVLTTLQTASAEAARRMAQIVQYYAGETINIVERVAATQELVFGKHQENAPQEDSPREDDEDEDEGHVLRSADLPPPRPTNTPRPSTASSGDSGYLKLYGGDDE